MANGTMSSDLINSDTVKGCGLVDTFIYLRCLKSDPRRGPSVQLRFTLARERSTAKQVLSSSCPLYCASDASQSLSGPCRKADCDCVALVVGGRVRGIRAACGGAEGTCGSGGASVVIDGNHARTHRDSLGCGRAAYYRFRRLPET